MPMDMATYNPYMVTLPWPTHGGLQWTSIDVTMTWSPTRTSRVG